MLEIQKFIVTIQLPVVFFLIIASYQSARMFNEVRFKAIAIGWGLNLLYLVMHGQSLQAHAAPLHGFLADLLALSSSYCFLIAARLHIQRSNYTWRLRITRKMLAGTALFACAVLMGIVETWHLFTPAIRWGVDAVTVAHAVTDVTFHGFAIYSLARYLYLYRVRRVAADERLLEGSGILPLGMYGYASIQIFYLLALLAQEPWQSRIMIWGFVLGLTAKTAISVGYFHLFVTITKEAVRERARLDEARAVVGRINHEAMTPLLEMGLTIEELQRIAPRRGRVHENVEMLDNALHRVRAIMEAARNVTFLIEAPEAKEVDRSSEGEASPDPVVVNVNSLVQTAVMAVKSTRKEMSVTWRLQYSGNLCIHCVPSEIVQVMVNLLRNACDAFPTRKGEISIVTSRVNQLQLISLNPAEGEDAPVPEPGRIDQVRVEVRDNGEGISPAIRSSIFEEGFSTRTGGNRGNGLYIVKQLVKTNGGTLEVISPAFPERTQSPGTEFVLCFSRVPCKQ